KGFGKRTAPIVQQRTRKRLRAEKVSALLLPPHRRSPKRRPHPIPCAVKLRPRDVEAECLPIRERNTHLPAQTPPRELRAPPRGPRRVPRAPWSRARDRVQGYRPDEPHLPSYWHGGGRSSPAERHR